MIGLRTIVILLVLLALTFAVIGDNGKEHSRHARHMNIHFPHAQPCTRNPDLYAYYPACPGSPQNPHTSTTTTTTPVPVNDDSSEESAEDLTRDTNTDIDTDTTTDTSTTAVTSEEPTSLERAHWCRFPNDTYVPLNYLYLRNGCSICRCTKSRSIRCQLLQCMPTYCLNNKMPVRKAGQCCTQCEEDFATNSSCFYDGINYPHGTLIKTVENKMQCWCQLGNIECRTYFGSLFDVMNFWADGAAVYMILMVLFVIITFGLFLCCSGTVIFYIYYQRHRDIFQQAYDQYINTAGWEPIEENEEIAFSPNTEEEKYLQDEQYYYDESYDKLNPPPYGIPNNSYVSEPEEKKL